MKNDPSVWRALGGVAVSAALVFGPSAARAGTYPTNACVSKKLKATSNFCKSILKAWSKWEKDPNKDPAQTALEASIDQARSKFSLIWGKAEATALKKGVDCTETTETSTAIDAILDLALDDVAAEINADIDPMTADKADLTCRAKILKAAATKCGALLKAESKFVKKPENDPLRATLAAAKVAASNKFDSAWTKAACNTTVTVETIEGKLDDLASSVVEKTTISPNVPTTWTMITPDSEVDYQGKTLRPICSLGTDYVFFVKRGSVNKLLVYYQGGGACFDWFTCGGIGSMTCKDATGPGDNPASYTNGFGDLTNPLNPFKDWNAVFIPYCTCDVHWGDKVNYYPGPPSIQIYHRGFHNAQVVERWAREHFVTPTDIFVTGSSAGAYGAIMNGIYLHKAYPASRLSVVGDAGNGVITDDFLSGVIPGGRKWGIKNWGVENNLPVWIPGIDLPIEDLSISKLWANAANFYPRSMFGQYTTAWDGSGGGQVAFYNVMLNPNDLINWPKWWEPTCQWHDNMVTLVNEAVALSTNNNYRYYIGAGSRHTMWGSDKVYTDTTGGVPTVLDWITDMMTDPTGPNWINAQCSTCNLVDTCQGGANAGLSCTDDSDCPGGYCQFDPRPSPLAPPYEPGGVVNCP